MLNHKYCLLTNDVETMSIWHNSLRDETGWKVYREGMPALLEIYSNFNIKTTFFVTGYIAKLIPDIVNMIVAAGHEVGSHGLTHLPHKAFDVLPLKTQIEHLTVSKKIIEDICGEEVVSFRAPAARVNNDTAQALLETGYKIDSSIASQRFDMFLSFGNMKKLRWFFTPRKPYFTSEKSLFKSGKSDILEIPISALIYPYIGTTMRCFPQFTRGIRQLLKFETEITKKPIVFLIHPNEFIDESDEKHEVKKRANNYLSYVLGDLARRKLKINNLGARASTLYVEQINYFKNNNFEFITCKELYFRTKNHKERKHAG